MTWLILGIVLWWAAHFFKRLAPGPRAAMTARMGEGSKGVIAAVIVVALVLMIVGYRVSDFTPVFDPPAWGRHANSALMLLAVLLFGLGSSKSPLRAKMRHPMLTGTYTWAVAHLLVNGDLASLVLFGSFLVWAFIEIIVINASEPDWTPYEGGSTAGTVRLLVISAVVYAVIVGIHTWLGYNPFAGG